MADSKHTLLTGKINSGKSTRLMAKVEQWIQGGKNVSGWISLPAFEEDQKTGYNIVFVIKSKISLPERFIRSEFFEGAIPWRRFFFDRAIFDRVKEIDFGIPDIFVIDEIGPLEIEDKHGFWPQFGRIYATYPETFTVVRENCVENFLKETGFKSEIKSI